MPPDDVASELVDLSGLTLDDILGMSDDELDAAFAALLSQVERPRFNLGSGPPGRAD